MNPVAIIRLKVKKLQSLKEKSAGLIGKKKIKPVYFTTRWGIHTFGVLSPIDVIILDGDMRVVKVKESLLPNRICIWNPKYRHVIELPPGAVAGKNIKPGSNILI